MGFFATLLLCGLCYYIGYLRGKDPLFFKNYMSAVKNQNQRPQKKKSNKVSSGKKVVSIDGYRKKIQKK